MTETYNVTLNNIDVDPGRRSINEAKVDALVESIKAIGLHTPPTVRLVGDGDRIVLVAGAHRLAAMKRLGWDAYELPILPDDQDPRLWEIDKNLCRAELTATERADFTAKRKAIYEEKHPGTGHGGDRSSSRQLGELNRFTTDTAKVTGQSERKVQRDAERGAKVCDEARALIKGTPVDTGSFLDRLKSLPAEEQVETAKAEIEHRERVKADAKLSAEEEPAKASLKRAVIEAAERGLRTAGRPRSSNKNPLYVPPTPGEKAWLHVYGTAREFVEWASEEKLKLAIEGHREKSAEYDQALNRETIPRVIEVFQEIQRRLECPSS